ncbi:hypothetical protein PBY51_006832 [Eleginops maclovinus]|uniref:Uncharacterized protein n=1 Tax=Eleginops maclovinus TaxID=56733 RepID=A0AAN7WX28_ELEMC|nr:hypothetical protein PBY51_006832 [Eleginops maclovinus]
MGEQLLLCLGIEQVGHHHDTPPSSPCSVPSFLYPSLFLNYQTKAVRCLQIFTGSTLRTGSVGQGPCAV